MSIIKEFREFISRGNVIDMAVGVVIGTAFKSIVDSLVNGIIMPAVGMLLANIDFSDLKTVLKPAVGEQAEVALLWGSVIQAILNFLIIALVIFLAIKAVNQLHKKMADALTHKQEVAAEPEAPAAPTEAELLADILAELRSQHGQIVPKD